MRGSSNRHTLAVPFLAKSTALVSEGRPLQLIRTALEDEGYDWKLLEGAMVKQQIWAQAVQQLAGRRLKLLAELQTELLTQLQVHCSN